MLRIFEISEDPATCNLSLILGDLIWHEFTSKLEYMEATKK